MELLATNAGRRSAPTMSRACMLIAVLAAGRAGAAPNLVANGSFEQVEDQAPADWAAYGDANVKQALSVDVGKIGRFAAKLDCTAFDQRSPASHAMLAQVGKVALVKGKTYRLSCWMRQEHLAGRQVRVAISDTSVWANCGLDGSFSVGSEWRQHVTFFTATRSAEKTTRLQFWHGETGTLWVDDVQLTEVGKIDLAFTDRIEPGQSRNLLPNASFECGRSGWASLGRRAGWGNLSGLYGQVQEGDAAHGRYCLRIDLGPGMTPVTYFDYFNPVRVEQTAPLAANLGWVKVRKDAKYTLSAWMRADRDGVPGALLIRLCDPAGWPNDHSKKVVLSPKWRRFDLTVSPWREWVFVAVGPDLGEGRDPAATVWIDAVQLEQADSPTDFIPRQPLEIGLETARFGNILAAGEPVRLLVAGCNQTAQAADVELSAMAEDFFGHQTPAGKLRLAVPPGGAARTEWTLEIADCGWYAVDVSWEHANRKHANRLRLAVVRPYQADDSPFGINHAPPTAELCRLLRQAGVVWARDWSLKWQHIEPAPGRFDASPADVQIDRVLATGMKQTCLLPPFPSANWASSAPPALDQTGYPGVRLAMAYAPKDPKLLYEYVQRCVRHYKDRVNVWDFLNEPIYTDYSLPAANKGVPGAAYTVADYVRLLRGAYAAMKRADPACRVLGGIGSGPDHLVPEFIAAGGMDCCDILNLHIYPGKAPPEGFLEPMQRLAERMRKAGKVLPVWVTEYSYYAADTPPWEPFIPQPGHWAGNRLLDDERQCADYSVRFAVVMLASGVEKVFYHSGGSGEVNQDPLECCLLGYAGLPRRAYAAQAALAGFLGPDPRYACRLNPPRSEGVEVRGVYAFAFDCGHYALVVAWADEDQAGKWRLLPPDGAEQYDITGRRAKRPLDSSPVYVVRRGASATELAASCRFAP